MNNDDHDHWKQGKSLKGQVAHRHMVKVETIGYEEYRAQNTGEWMQPQQFS